MRILVTGGYGQLGSELKFLSSFYNNFEWIFTDTDEFDLTDIKKIDFKITSFSPDIIIDFVIYCYYFEIMAFCKVDCHLKPIETKGYLSPAKRPHFFVLNKSKIKNDFEIEIPYWRDSLAICI